MQVYDLAWSPSGEYIITGSTDNCARIFSAADGKCFMSMPEFGYSHPNREVSSRAGRA
jgi:chromatin assembly factor 1 subunit B